MLLVSTSKTPIAKGYKTNLKFGIGYSYSYRVFHNDWPQVFAYWSVYKAKMPNSWQHFNICFSKSPKNPNITGGKVIKTHKNIYSQHGSIWPYLHSHFTISHLVFHISVFGIPDCRAKQPCRMQSPDLYCNLATGLIGRFW